MFLLSNLERAGFEDRGHRFNGTHAGLFEGEELVGVACHYRLGNLIVNAPKSAEALAKAALQASKRPMHAVVGPESHVEAVARGLGLKDGDAAQIDEREGLYRLDLNRLQIPSDLTNAVVRGRDLASTDLDLVSEWNVRYRVEAVGDTETDELRQRVRENLEASVGCGEVWVLEREGELVACTQFNAQLPDSVQIGGVWTPHALRGRGHARCVVASHLLAAQAAGVRTAILFTGDTNLPAQRCYAALGFESVGRYRVLVLRDRFKLDDDGE
ncbi:MAG: GNAT family N-acetyltransferase, partial [Nannocystaceae bacterium]